MFVVSLQGVAATVVLYMFRTVFSSHHREFKTSVYLVGFNKKGKSVPLQAWSGPEGSGKLRFPDFVITAQDGGKVVSLTHRPPLPPGNAPGTHFVRD